MPSLPDLPDLSSQDLLTIVLALVTATLLALAHAVNAGGPRQVLSCSAIAAGALASLSLFGLDIGQVGWLQLDQPAQTQNRSQGHDWTPGSAANGGGGQPQAGKTGGSTGQGDGTSGSGGTAAIPSGFSRASFKSQPDLKPFRDCADCPEMVPVPAGFAKVGADASDPRAEPAEMPQRIVTIGRPFALGRTEITIGQYAAFALATSRAMPACPDVGAAQTTLPMQCVSFEDAQAYVVWLSDKTGRVYRLPSASEWEYAARAGGEPTRADDLSSIAGTALAPRPAGSLPANGFGLQDMTGNVAELVADCWTPELAAVPTDGRPVGGACSQRVLKDAAWSELALWSRPSARRAIAASTARPGVGFRVACEL